jgi:hypothetical protein
MEALFAALEATGPAELLRGGRWSYATVNALHILGIALLVGSILPLDLRLLGVWRSVPLAPLARVLRPAAAGGLALAATMGLLLFSVRAGRYAEIGVMQLKAALILIALANALALARTPSDALERLPRGRRRLHGTLSLCCWVGALFCGRLVAFAEG